MKNSFLLRNSSMFVLVLFVAIGVTNGQNKSYNLNDTLSDNSNKISISAGNSQVTFQNVKRFRDFFLNPILQKSEVVKVNDTILLDLFNDKQYKALIDHIDVDINGTIIIRAKLKGFNYGSFFISTYMGESYMTVEVPENNELYKSNYNHQTNQYYLLQVDKSKVIELEGNPPIVPQTDHQLNVTSKKKSDNTLVAVPGQTTLLNSKSVLNDLKIQSSPDTPETITLMIVYTPSAAAWSSSNETNINNTISLLMTKAQLALDNSNTLITLKLCHSEQVSYTELNSVNDLYNLKNTTDGYMDNVHSLRETYCADIVGLLENIDYTGGQGYLLESVSGNSSEAFSLTRVQQASWSFTTIHEIGHNMGCHHHKLQNVQPGPGLNSYSAGWRWTDPSGVKYCSVMTYQEGTYFADGINATRVPYFSNPDIQYNGVPVGNAVDADNARTLREVKSVVANYRFGCIPDLIIAVGTQSVTPSSIQAGSTLTAYCAENNLGTVSAGANVISIHLSADDILTPGENGDTYLGEISIPGVPANTCSIIYSNSILMPSNVTPGNYYVFFSADGGQAINEVFENNNFASLPVIVTTACTPPTTQATTFTSSGMTNTTMTVSWTRGNGNEVLVVARQGSAVNAAPVNGIVYSANRAFGSGTQIGIGNYVVYDGTGTSVNLTTLTSGTTYYYAVYEYSSGINCFKTPALIGNSSTLSSGGTVTDIDGNVYSTVTIGTQVWMGENLKTTKFNDNSNIPPVTSNYVWSTLTTPGFCWYNNDETTYKATYGALYNWYTINAASNGGKNVCPTGWNLPTDGEWNTLISYLGGESVAGGKMKETGYTHWLNPNTGATNVSGFTALPGGYRSYSGFCSLIGYNGYWWSATENNSTSAWDRDLYFGGNNVGRSFYNKQYGYSIRCLKVISSLTQDIALATNWNILSFAVEPTNMSLLAIVNPIIAAGTLTKIQDEKGNAIEKLPEPINWVDNIGQMKVSEGYKIKVTGNTTLTVTGPPVTLPYTITLDAGWNIMGYPSMTSQAALTAFDPLITAATLLKVQDEAGNAIEKLPAPIGWIDNIHNLSQGNGYKVKTSINTSLAISNSAKGEYQNAEVLINKPAHFKLVYSGNGLDQMNIYIKKPTVGGVEVKPGDEIGVFDGVYCVGAVYIDEPNVEYFMAIASIDDPNTSEQDGFKEGNKFELRLWDNQSGIEREAHKAELDKGYNKLFEKLGTSVLAVDFETKTASYLGDAFPNPSTDRTTFTFQLEKESIVRLEIYNMDGDMVKLLVDQNMSGGMHRIEWDNRTSSGSRVGSGVYFYRLKFDSFMQTKQLVIR